jgi:hypothetical protein
MQPAAAQRNSIWGYNAVMNQTRVIFLLFVWAGLTMPGSLGGQLVRRSGRHIDLVTDLESAAEADDLVASFDAAVPQWAEFWQLEPDALAGWKVDAFVIRDSSLYRQQGLIPDHIPKFPFGYASGNSIWVLAQPSEYYTRHLLLHEGVHALAFSQFGGGGPTWFMEGSAELLATHRGQAAAIEINRIPDHRDSAPYWGRFKLMTQLRHDGAVPTIERVMRYPPSLSGNVATYGWSWGAAMLMSAYPEYRPALIEAARHGKQTGPGFNRWLYRQISQAKWPVVAARWRIMCHDLDYGFDWSREKVMISEVDPLWDGNPLEMTVPADQGWQSAGVRFAPGTRVEVRGSGQVLLDSDPKPWISHPSGITFQYHRGRPLGQLLACVLPNAADDGDHVRPLKVIAVGEQATLSIDQHSWLLLRVNDRVGDLGNNRGAFDVKISRDTP